MSTEVIAVSALAGTQDGHVTTVRDHVTVKRATPSKPSPSPETRPHSSKSSKAADYSSTKSSTSSYNMSSYGDHLGVGALAREFRGTSPSVIENIATHPLLFEPHYEPLRKPKLSARSKKALRDTADLAVLIPGLRNLLEVQYRVLLLLLSRVCLLLAGVV